MSAMEIAPTVSLQSLLTRRRPKIAAYILIAVSLNVCSSSSSSSVEELSSSGPHLHSREPQWSLVHGYWQGKCVDVSASGDAGDAFERWVVASSADDVYEEKVISEGAATWQTDVRATSVVMSDGKTSVNSAANDVRTRTTAVGRNNSLHTFFYDGDGTLTHSRLVSFRRTGGVLRRIVSTQSFADGFEPSGLVECKEEKLRDKAAADQALSNAGLLATPGPALADAEPRSDEVFEILYEECNKSTVVLADYPQWADEDGFWVGEYSYFGANMRPNYVPDRWNYPYDHYRGFITGSVDGGSYSQRNTFFYPPQTEDLCALNDNTFVESEACGSTGAVKRFLADQTTEYCNAHEGGRISGPYGEDSTTTTLIGTQAVLYQIWSDNANEESVLYQSQMTTITRSSGQIRRTRTAQFFDKDTGNATWFSFYRELKVSEDDFWTQFDETRVNYYVTDTALSQSCYGGFEPMKLFMEGSMDWDGDKYTCPLAPPSFDGASFSLATWSDNGADGWAGYFGANPAVTDGAFLTAAQLAMIPNVNVELLRLVGWVEVHTLEELSNSDVMASPPVIWTDAGASGWAEYFPSNPVTAGALLTAAQLAQVLGATVTSLVNYGWVETLAYA